MIIMIHQKCAPFLFGITFSFSSSSICVAASDTADYAKVNVIHFQMPTSTVLSPKPPSSVRHTYTINQSINQTSIAPISLAKPDSVGLQSNQCSAAKSMKQFRKHTAIVQQTIILPE